MAWLLGLQQLAITLQTREFLSVRSVHEGGVLLADILLHLRVYSTGSHGDGGDVFLFDRESQSKVVEDCFSGTIGSPCGVGGHGGTGGSEDDFAP